MQFPTKSYIALGKTGPKLTNSSQLLQGSQWTTFQALLRNPALKKGWSKNPQSLMFISYQIELKYLSN